MQRIRTVLLITSVLGSVAIAAAVWNGEARARDARASTTVTATRCGAAAGATRESGEPDVGQAGKQVTTSSRVGQGSEEPGGRWRVWAGWTAGMWTAPYFWLVPIGTGS